MRLEAGLLLSLVNQPSEFLRNFRAGFEPRVVAKKQLTDDLAQKRVGRIDRKHFPVPNQPARGWVTGA